MCEDIFAGRIDTSAKLQEYFKVMGSLYSYHYDSASSAISGAPILEPAAGNRAYGPGGFLRTLDLRRELSAIKAPTLIVAGRHDWIHPPEFSTEIHQLIDQAEQALGVTVHGLIVALEGGLGGQRLRIGMGGLRGLDHHFFQRA